jgi:hypothetical protein
LIDFTGGALKKGRKHNILAEVVERRKDEGNFLRLFFPARSANQDPHLLWISRAIRGLVVLLGCGLLAWVVFFNPGQPQDPNVPGTGAGPRASGPDARGGQLPPAERPESAAPGAGEHGSPEESFFPAVVREGVRFRPPLPDFKPLEKLDPNVLDEVWDTDQVLRSTPWIANNLKAEHGVVDHIYRFLRTHTPEELAPRAAHDLTHRDMLVSPGFHRGKIVSMRAKLLRIYHVLSWEEEEGKRTESGVLDTTMLFVRDATPRRNPYIFVVLTAEPPWEFQEQGVYEFTGVFMKRYPYQRKDSKWETHPLLVSMSLKPADMTGEDSFMLTVAIVVAAAVAMIVLYFAVRGETRESEEKRSQRLERRRVGRERLMRRAESSRSGPPGDEQGEPGGDGPPPEGGGPENDA